MRVNGLRQVKCVYFKAAPPTWGGLVLRELFVGLGPDFGLGRGLEHVKVDDVDHLLQGGLDVLGGVHQPAARVGGDVFLRGWAEARGPT